MKAPSPFGSTYSVSVPRSPLVFELAALGAVVVLGVVGVVLAASRVSSRADASIGPVAVARVPVQAAPSVAAVSPRIAVERAGAADGDIPHSTELSTTGDSVQGVRDGWDVAVLSGEAGVLEVLTYPATRLQIDGRSYDVRVGDDTRVTRVPITSGHHQVDFVSDAYTFAVRREVEVTGGSTTRIVLDLSDRMPERVAPPTATGSNLRGGEGMWYVGNSGGRPVFNNTLGTERQMRSMPPPSSMGSASPSPGGSCCEEGLTWQGCCPTPSSPVHHRCGLPGTLCKAACGEQLACGRSSRYAGR